MGALSACTSAHQRGVSDVCELPCGCWESNSGPLEGQWVLLTPSHPPAQLFLSSTLFCTIPWALEEIVEMSCSRLNPQHFCILPVVGSHEFALTLAHYKDKSLWQRMRIALKTRSFWNDISCWFVHSLNLFTSKGKDLSLIYWFLEFLLWITFSDLSSFFFWSYWSYLLRKVYYKYSLLWFKVTLSYSSFSRTGS